MPIQKIVQRAIHSSETLTNRIIFFVAGLLLSIIFFALMLKFFGTWGLYLYLACSGMFNYWLKKHRRQNIYKNAFNNGLITFNIILVIGTLLIFIVFFGALQNLLN